MATESAPKSVSQYRGRPAPKEFGDEDFPAFLRLLAETKKQEPEAYIEGCVDSISEDVKDPILMKEYAQKLKGIDQLLISPYAEDLEDALSGDLSGYLPFVEALADHRGVEVSEYFDMYKEDSGLLMKDFEALKGEEPLRDYHVSFLDGNTAVVSYSLVGKFRHSGATSE